MTAKQVLWGERIITWFLYNQPFTNVWRVSYQREFDKNSAYDQAKLRDFEKDMTRWFHELDDEHQGRIAEAAIKEYGAEPKE